jgi:PAS domain S-box-containing protein
MTNEATEVSAIWSSRDMTERRAAEDALRETNVRLQAIFQAANDAILVVDPAADRILDANRRACQLFEYDHDELVETRLSTIQDHERDRFGAFVEQCLRHGFWRSDELSCQTRTGRIIPAAVSASTVELAEGVALLAVVRDLTEQREAEVDQARLAAIVKGSVDAIVGLDLQGVITTWNSAAERLLGHAAGDVIGRHVDVLVPEQEKAQQQAAHLRVLRGELVRDWECQRVRHDGTLIPVSITLSVIRDAAGAPLGLAKFVRDVRDRNIAETLQRALLPETAPDLPGLFVATRYFPGGAGLQVGGDWYDVFALPGGRFGVAVGDVIGQGVNAAAVMGQLRVALRAYALEFSSPATVLACLGRLACSLDDSQMATVLYGVVDPDGATIELASAGHPPPLVVRADGAASFLELDGAPPLGVLVDLAPTQVVERIEPGCVMLFYTDGLVERRGASIEDGMAAVARAAAGPADVESLCERVSEAMKVEAATDDVALLALSLADR